MESGGSMTLWQRIGQQLLKILTNGVSLTYHNGHWQATLNLSLNCNLLSESNKRSNTDVQAKTSV